MCLFKGICCQENASPHNFLHCINKFHFKTFSKVRKANFSYLEKHVRI